MVPIFDLANHGILHEANDSYHSLGRKDASVDAPFDSIDMFGRRILGSDPSRKEFCISYGEKGNRVLMDQYGFTVAGNPHDQICDWLDPGLLPTDIAADERVSRDRVMAAASRLTDRALSCLNQTSTAGTVTGPVRIHFHRKEIEEDVRRLQTAARCIIKLAGCR